MTDCGARWYVVRKAPHLHAQEKAASHLIRQGYSVHLPRYLKRRRHARRVETVSAPVFPRYLFVAINRMTQRWRAIQSTVGVMNLVCNGEDPACMPEAVMSELRSREDERGFVQLNTRPRFAPGDRIFRRPRRIRNLPWFVRGDGRPRACGDPARSVRPQGPRRSRRRRCRRSMGRAAANLAGFCLFGWKPNSPEVRERSNMSRYPCHCWRCRYSILKAISAIVLTGSAIPEPTARFQPNSGDRGAKRRQLMSITKLSGAARSNGNVSLPRVAEGDRIFGSAPQTICDEGAQDYLKDGEASEDFCPGHAHSVCLLR